LRVGDAFVSIPPFSTTFSPCQEKGVPLQSHRDDRSQTKRRKRLWPLVLVLLILLGILVVVLSWGWSGAPEPFDVVARAKAVATATGQTEVIGYVTTNTLIEVATILLDKSGGYVSNDITPPGVFLDNITNWEYGVLTQIRDLSLVMRNDFTRSQTQSTEDSDLAIAQPKFNYDSDSWAFPASENEYREGITALARFRRRQPGQLAANGREKVGLVVPAAHGERGPRTSGHGFSGGQRSAPGQGRIAECLC
jgi:hypothetical protein